MSDIIDWEWYKTKSSEDYFNSLLNHGKRKQFGLLERPSLPPQKVVDVINYKIFVCGKSNVGKTATVAKLAGSKVHKNVVGETIGIEVTSVYWPVRLITTGQIVFFCLQFWDVGDNAIQKFDHILPACKDQVDCILFLFSFTDRTSFTGLSQYLNRLTDGVDKIPASLVIGTKSDQYIHSDISDDEIQDLAETRNVPVMRTQNLTQHSASDADHFKDVAPFLNKICELLWARDQQLSNSYARVSQQQQYDV